MGTSAIVRDDATNYMHKLRLFRGAVWLKEAFWRLHEPDILGRQPMPRSMIEELRDMYAQSILMGMPHPDLESQTNSYDDLKHLFEKDLKELNTILGKTPGGVLTARFMKT